MATVWVRECTGSFDGAWGALVATHFEPVHVFADWNDGPRCGLADFHGRPHLYQSLYRDAEGRDEPVQDHFALVAVPEADVQALLVRLRSFWPLPDSLMFCPAFLSAEQEAAFEEAWSELRRRTLAAADRPILAAGEMREQAASRGPAVPEGEESPMEVCWSVRAPGWVSGAALRERLVEMERRWAEEAARFHDGQGGEDLPF